MHRLAIALAILLSFTTGVTLAETRKVALPPLPRPRAPSAAVLISVERFYMAINHMLATGDASELEPLLDRAFRDEQPAPGTTGDRDGFLQNVRALHDAASTLRLELDDVIAQGDDAAVLVTATKGDDEPSELLQTTGRLWPRIDVLRFDGDQLLARRSDQAGVGFIATSVTVTLPLAVQVRPVAELFRETYDQEPDEWEVESGPILILVEAGQLRVVLDAEPARPATLVQPKGNSRPVISYAEIVLAPGDALGLPPGIRYRAWSDDASAAVTLTVRLKPVVNVPRAPETDASGAFIPPEEARADRVSLAGGMVVRLTRQSVEITIARVVLAPHVGVSRHRVIGAEMVAVTAGTLDLTIENGRAYVQEQPSGEMEFENRGRTLITGGVVADYGTFVSYRASGSEPLSFLLVTMRPHPDGGDLMDESSPKPHIPGVP
ncbi:MAG TPA: nuclear transport factor 2 family protein [Thermomicrobiales bacterium]